MRALLAIAALVLAAGAIALWLAVRDRPAARDAAPPARDARPASTDTHEVSRRPDAAAVRELLANLRASGSASEAWTARGIEVLHDAAASDIGCFVAGCGGILTFASEQDYQQRRAAIEASSAYTAWTGGKRWTDAEQLRDGRVRVGLLLYRPD